MNTKIFRILLIVIIPAFTILLNSCSNTTEPETNNLIISDYVELPIFEPSALTFSANESVLWAAGDRIGEVYMMSTSGQILLNFDIGEEDIEGITAVNDTLLAAAVEYNRTIILFNTNGKILDTLRTGISGIINNGFEGITYYPPENVFVVVNQKNPTVIFKISLDGEVQSITQVNFPLDMKGIDYDETRGHFWILSDVGRTIFECNQNFEVLHEYRTPSENLEGIAVKGNDIYAVSDFAETLYHFKI